MRSEVERVQRGIVMVNEGRVDRRSMVRVVTMAILMVTGNKLRTAGATWV